jgi:hypothetical protein
MVTPGSAGMAGKGRASGDAVMARLHCAALARL